MSDLRDDILLKIQRAEKHIGDVHAILDAFIKSNPYGVSVKIDPQTQQRIYYLSKDAPIPDDVSVIAGDVLQNLRSALDYLAWRLVDANGGNPGKHTCFPIFDSAAQYQSGFARQVKGMRQEAIDVIHKIKPYNGGDNALWRLHRLNNIDKHRLLFTVGARIGAFDALQHLEVTDPDDMTFLGKAHSLAEAYSTGQWAGVLNHAFPLKAGDVILVDPPHTKVNENIKLGIHVAINEPGVCEGEALVVVLRSSWHRVYRVSQMFSALL